MPQRMTIFDLSQVYAIRSYDGPILPVFYLEYLTSGGPIRFTYLSRKTRDSKYAEFANSKEDHRRWCESRQNDTYNLLREQVEISRKAVSQ